MNLETAPAERTLDGEDRSGTMKREEKAASRVRSAVGRSGTYLEAAFDDGDPRLITAALGDIAKSNGDYILDAIASSI